MGKLVIKRSPDYLNKNKDIELFLDDKKIGSVKNGEYFEYVVEEGKHELKAKINWLGSKKMKIDIRNTDQVVYLKSFKKGNILLRIMALLTFFLIVFKNYIKEYSKEYLVLVLVMPIIAVFLYYLTFERNNYLELDTEL